MSIIKQEWLRSQFTTTHEAVEK